MSETETKFRGATPFHIDQQLKDYLNDNKSTLNDNNDSIIFLRLPSKLHLWKQFWQLIKKTKKLVIVYMDLDDAKLYINCLLQEAQIESLWIQFTIPDLWKLEDLSYQLAFTELENPQTTLTHLTIRFNFNNDTMQMFGSNDINPHNFDLWFKSFLNSVSLKTLDIQTLQHPFFSHMYGSFYQRFLQTSPLVFGMFNEMLISKSDISLVTLPENVFVQRQLAMNPFVKDIHIEFDQGHFFPVPFLQTRAESKLPIQTLSISLSDNTTLSTWSEILTKFQSVFNIQNLNITFYATSSNLKILTKLISHMDTLHAFSYKQKQYQKQLQFMDYLYKELLEHKTIRTITEFPRTQNNDFHNYILFEKRVLANDRIEELPLKFISQKIKHHLNANIRFRNAQISTTLLAKSYQTKSEIDESAIELFPSIFEMAGINKSEKKTKSTEKQKIQATARRIYTSDFEPKTEYKSVKTTSKRSNSLNKPGCIVM